MKALSSIFHLSSIASLRELTSRQIQALMAIGITRLSDLLRFDPIKNAQLLMMLANNEIVIDMNKTGLFDDSAKYSRRALGLANLHRHQGDPGPARALRARLRICSLNHPRTEADR